eukprot:493835_1
MAFTSDHETKSQMKLEMAEAVDDFMFGKFTKTIPLYKTTHQRMAQCYDKHKKAKPIWECLSNTQRMYKNAQGYLNSLVTENLTEPASDCLKDSVGSTQALANEEYAQCVRTQIGIFKKVRNECVA